MANATPLPLRPVSAEAVDSRPHVVILGGGFGGINAAKVFANQPVRVTLVDKRNFHLFQPLLYQVATANLSPSDIAYPIRAILKKARNVTVLLDEAEAIDPDRQVVHLKGGDLDYDYLVVAAGATGTWFGHDVWQDLAPGLKSMEEALDIRSRVLSAFEEAERTDNPDDLAALMTFVVVGGGATGVELAGALAEISRQTLKGNFRRIDPAQAKIILVEGGDSLLETYPKRLRKAARRSLERLGVEVRTGERVLDIQSDRVQTSGETIPARTVLWGAGVTGQPIAATLGVPLVRGGRVPVEPTLQAPGLPNVYVVGDLAAFDDGKGGNLPGVAQVAMQGGKRAAKNILAAIRGEEQKPFKYFDKGNMATIGWNRAVAQIGPIQLSGFIAWAIWALIHIVFLIGYRSRVTVMWQWMWAYITRNRAARLIVGYSEGGSDTEGANRRVA